MEISAFEGIGLTPREIKVYLALIELGSTKIGRILEKTQIPSSKIYEILGRLQDKGLVSYVKVENTRHYQASNPNSILTFLDEKRTKISEVIPELIEKQKFAQEKQSVEIFEGPKAIFNLLTNMISSAKPGEFYLAFTHGEEHQNELINIFYKKFIKLRNEKKLLVKLLTHTHVKPLFEKIYTKEEFKQTHTRFTDFNFPQGLTIFQDNLIFVTWGEHPTAVRMKSERISSDFRAFFLQLWNLAK